MNNVLHMNPNSYFPSGNGFEKRTLAMAAWSDNESGAILKAPAPKPVSHRLRHLRHLSSLSQIRPVLSSATQPVSSPSHFFPIDYIHSVQSLLGWFVVFHVFIFVIDNITWYVLSGSYFSLNLRFLCGYTKIWSTNLFSLLYSYSLECVHTTNYLAIVLLRNFQF